MPPTMLTPRVTISQIAKEAGAAKSTVSCVLNGKFKESGASAARIAVIQEVAGRLNYRPSAAARAMRTGRFNAIGLVLGAQPGHTSPFADLALGLLVDLRQRNLSLTVASLPDEALAVGGFVPRMLGEWAVDGLLVDGVHEAPERMGALIRQHHIPSVWLNARLERDCVRADDAGATRLAVEHLLGLGHRRIAYHAFAPTAHHSHHDRADGYAQAMRAAGLEPRVLRAPIAVVPAERLAWSRQLLAASDRPTAVVAYGVEDALPLMVAALGQGLRVPDDLSLIAVHPGPAHFTGLPLTTLVVPVAAIGRAALAMLLERIADPRREQPAQAVPFTLDPGMTCAPPAR
jgi:LacI family transcriptional regulator